MGARSGSPCISSICRQRRFADAGVAGVAVGASGFQLFDDDAGGAGFFEAEFRIGVQVTADFSSFGPSAWMASRGDMRAGATPGIGWTEYGREVRGQGESCEQQCWPHYLRVDRPLGGCCYR